MDMMSLRRRVMINQNKLVNATGNPITFNTPLTKPLKECVVRFTPKQEGSGTPSPDNVRNISGRSSVKLWQSGKNLFDKASAKMGRYESVNGVWTFVENASWYASDLIRVKPNTRYSMFCGTPLSSIGGYINVYDENMARVTYTTYLSYITTTADAKYLSVHVAGTSPVYKNRDTVMICEGSDVPSEYEPYTGNEITFSWDSDPEIGTIYGGYVDCETADLVVEYAEKVITGDENWQLNAWNGNGVYMRTLEQGGTSTRLPFKMGQAYGNMLSYNYNGLNPVVDGSFAVFGADTIPNYTYLIIYNTAWGTTLEEYKAKLKELYEAGTPLTIVAPLKTAYVQHYSLTPQSIATLRGENVMWSDANGDITVRYWTR